MNGIEKITEKIIGEARLYEEVTLEETSKSCADIRDKYASEADFIKAKAADRANKEAESIISRALSNSEQARRNALLSAKSEMIDRAFALALDKLCALGEAEYRELFTRLLKDAVNERLETRRRNADEFGDIYEGDTAFTIITNEHDAALAAAVSDGIGAKVTLSPERAAIRGGFILRGGDIEVNCSLEVLVSGLRDKLEGEVCRALIGA